MQDLTTWRPPSGALGRLTAAAYERAARLWAECGELERRVASTGAPASMADALGSGRFVGLIAEVKRRSPSRGAINEGLEAPATAAMYAAAGARAISVLTEPEEFGGSSLDLANVAAAGGPPVLKKDFHVDGVQLLEARALGASAALLIVRALPPQRLVELTHEAIALGVEPLLEVRSESELELALSTPGRMIGINARDLESLEVDADVVRRLLPLVPRDRIAIAESGLSARSDVERVASWGARAVLVGSALSRSGDPAALVAELSSVPRRA